MTNKDSDWLLDQKVWLEEGTLHRYVNQFIWVWEFLRGIVAFKKGDHMIYVFLKAVTGEHYE